MVFNVGCHARDASTPKRLKVVVQANTEDEDYQGALAFEAWVEQQTAGSIQVDIFTGSQLCGSNRECFEALMLGVAEVYIATPGGSAVVMPELQVLELPYLFPNDAVAEAVLAGPFLDTLREGMLQHTQALRLMTIGNTGGWRCFATTAKAVRRPEDLNGLRIRTVSSKLQIAFTQSLGASPTPVAWSELYTSLATGVVAGTKNGITDIVGMKFHEHLKYVLMDAHTYMAALWWISDRFYRNLSPRERAVVDTGFARLRSVTLERPKAREAEALAAFRQAGGRVYVPSAEEKQAFVDAAAPMDRWFRERYGSSWLDALTEAIAAEQAPLAP